MEKIDLHYKCVRLKWKLRELKNNFSFRIFLFRIRVKNFMKKDLLSDVKSLYPNILIDFNSIKDNTNDKIFKIPEGFKGEDLTKFYGRFVK